jgi:hypothetical protein
LEVYKNKQWVTLLENVNLFDADSKTLETISDLKDISVATCNNLNMPLQAMKIAA